jgi:hypothetical protein
MRKSGAQLLQVKKGDIFGARVGRLASEEATTLTGTGGARGI